MRDYNCLNQLGLWPNPHGFVFGLLPKGLVLMDFVAAYIQEKSSLSFQCGTWFESTQHYEAIWYRASTWWHKSWSFVCKIPHFRWECLFFSDLYYFSSCLCIEYWTYGDNLYSNSQSLTIMFNSNILHHQSIGSFFCCVINVCFNKIVVMRERFAKVTA